MNWTFKVINDWGTIWSDKHQKQWLLHMESGFNSHVFFHPALVKAWTDTYLPLRNISPLFVWAEHKNGNRVFLPLILWKKNWKGAFLKSIIPVCYSDFDYHDPIFSDFPSSDNIDSFWRFLHKYLSDRISFDELAIDGIHKPYAPSYVSLSNEESCPYIDLTSFKTLDDYQATLSGKLRGDIRRTLGKLSEQGELNYKTFSDEHLEEALQTLPELLECHRKRWPNAYKAPHFHENIVKAGLTSGVLHFSSITLDGVPMSWIMGFIYKGTYCFWMPTMNADFSKFSPGKINLQYCIQESLKLGLQKYDHLRGDELYKSKLTDKCDYVTSFTIKINSFASNLKHRLISIKKIITNAR